jgi:hypothetical protein
MLDRVYFRGRRARVISRRKSLTQNDKPVTRGEHKQITVIAADTQPLSIPRPLPGSSSLVQHLGDTGIDRLDGIGAKLLGRARELPSLLG